jgi:beta-1,4-mannosyltransferase
MLKSPIPPRMIAVDPLTSDFNEFIKSFAEALTEIGLQAVNYNWGLRSLSKCDAVLFHWPNEFMSPGYEYEALSELAKINLVKKTHGLKVIWLAHNIYPHDSENHANFVRAAFIRSLDGIIYLSERSRHMVHEAYKLPRRIVEQVTVHGRYSAPELNFMPPASDHATRLVSFGLVRPYKNLAELVRAAAGLDPSRIEVEIVGKRHDVAYSATIEASAAAAEAIHLQLSDSIVSQTALDAAIDHAHGVVLPYRRILNSGSAILALSRARPVLVPAAGSMPELADLVGHDWVRLYEGPITEALLEDFARQVRLLPCGAAPDLSSLSWERVASDLRVFFSNLFDARASQPVARQEAS